jgi:hypothetical protein
VMRAVLCKLDERRSESFSIWRERIMRAQDSFMMYVSPDNDCHVHAVATVR